MTKAFHSQCGRDAVISYYNRLLEHLTIPYEKIHIPTRFGDTFALAAGDPKKPAVILLHGSCMNSAMWLDDIMAFAPHYHVIAPDIPGEPGQSSEIQLPFDSGDYANWLLDICHALNIETANLVGNSLGGWLALRFATLFPERVIKLGLLAPAGIGSQNPAFGLLAMELLPKGDEGISELFTQINGGVPIPETILAYQKLIMSVFNARQETIPIFSDEELKRLTMPCLIAVGGKDIMLKSEETAKRAAQQIPLCRVLELPERGHSLVGISEDLLDFLMRIDIA